MSHLLLLEEDREFEPRLTDEPKSVLTKMGLRFPPGNRSPLHFMWFYILCLLRVIRRSGLIFEIFSIGLAKRLSIAFQKTY